jgi:hypothetical protein
MKKLLFVGLISLSCATARCQFVQFNLDAEKLKDSGGSAMPTTGLVVLVASTSDLVFGGPSDTSFASGSDDIVLGKWDLTGFNQPGVLAAALTASLPLAPGGSLHSGDLVQMYWFPTLTIGSSAPGAGTSYGQYRDAVGIDGSQVWTTPSASSTRFLKFFTSDATFIQAGGSNPAVVGNASFTTVPEPSEYAMFFGIFCFAGALIRRSLKARSARA